LHIPAGEICKFSFPLRLPPGHCLSRQQTEGSQQHSILTCSPLTSTPLSLPTILS
ncbi:hypothetical protein T09_10904, partial [Trichinella sp. T9]